MTHSRTRERAADGPLPLRAGSGPAHCRQRRGRIVETNALVGACPTPDGILSVINRAACIALSKTLGMSLPKEGINVNSLNTGWIDTGQWNRPRRVGESVHVIVGLWLRDLQSQLRLEWLEVTVGAEQRVPCLDAPCCDDGGRSCCAP